LTPGAWPATRARRQRKPNLEVRVTLRLDRIAEAPMTLVINFIIYAAIVLVPLGLAFLFIRLGRRFSS
jgi:hypothetical protein